MEITVNGKQMEFSGSMQELLNSLKLKKDMVVAERNGEIVHREQYASVMIAEGDIIELVRFVGGG